MTFDQFWHKLSKTNGLDRYERLKFTVKEMKRMLELAYDEGHQAGASEAAASINRMVGDPVSESLKGIFGK